MTDLAVREDRALDRPAPDNTPSLEQATSALVQWAYEAHQAHLIAQKLAATSFVPASLRNKPADVTAAILAGQELGLKPMASLRSMDVIQGTPALRAHAMRGLVQSHGHDIELVESTDERCVMRGRRKGYDAWQTVEWDIARAQRLGLTGKDQWKKQPRTMLVARATGEICRLVAADVLYAMPYASEELDGYGEPGSGQVAVPPQQVTAAEIMGRSQVTAQSNGGPTHAEASAPDADAAADVNGVAAEMVSRDQQQRVSVLWAGLGYGGDENREHRLAITAKVLGLSEPLESSNDLTAEEAERLIAALEKKSAEPVGGAQ